MASDGGNREHPQCPSREEDQAFHKVIKDFKARLDPMAFTGEVGIVVAIINLGSPTGTIPSQREALEAKGFTCQTLEAHSVQDARRLIVLLAGFPCAEDYSHALRPMFPGPSGWFSVHTAGGEAAHLVRQHWGMVLGGQTPERGAPD